MRHVCIGLLILAGVNATPTSAADKPAWRVGLSDRELAIQRWFSYLTLQNDRSATPWAEWFDNGKELDVTSLRYQLAFCGYGCVAMAAKTPAYRELIERQLCDLCERMIDVRVWYYVTTYWKYGDGPPDPCLYENVMYTGHLTQLMCLYELMTGDRQYSTRGWDFVWRDGRKLHYTLEKAIQRLHTLTRASRTGGICCEPDLIFAVCNSHSATSFILFDLVHGTHYAKANARWFKWMSKYFRNRLPTARTFLYVVYKGKEDVFLPVGDAGGDGWALGWGYPWYPDRDFASAGWRFLLERAQWAKPRPDQMYAKVNPALGCCGGSGLGMANSFLPLVGVQVKGADSVAVRRILNWLDARFARQVDTDGDGHEESFYYHTCQAYRIPATGNIAAGLATDGDSMRRLYRTPRKDILSAPSVAHVDYPNVYVRSAEYIAPVLRFTVIKGTPRFSGETRIVCQNIKGPASVTRDGKRYDRCSQTGSTVTIRTDVEAEHVFEVTAPLR